MRGRTCFKSREGPSFSAASQVGPRRARGAPLANRTLRDEAPDPGRCGAVGDELDTTRRGRQRRLDGDPREAATIGHCSAAIHSDARPTAWRARSTWKRAQGEGRRCRTTVDIRGDGHLSREDGLPAGEPRHAIHQLANYSGAM